MRHLAIVPAALLLLATPAFTRTSGTDRGQTDAGLCPRASRRRGNRRGAPHVLRSQQRWEGGRRGVAGTHAAAAGVCWCAWRPAARPRGVAQPRRPSAPTDHGPGVQWRRVWLWRCWIPDRRYDEAASSTEQWITPATGVGVRARAGRRAAVRRYDEGGRGSWPPATLTPVLSPTQLEEFSTVLSRKSEMHTIDTPDGRHATLVDPAATSSRRCGIRTDLVAVAAGSAVTPDLRRQPPPR